MNDTEFNNKSTYGFRSLKPNLINSITLLNKVKNNDENRVLEYLDNKININEEEGEEEEDDDNDQTKESANKPSFWIEGYGCSSSIADMEMIAGQLKNIGYTMSKNPSKSSINLIVTCSVKDVTEHKMSYRIKSLSQYNKPLVIAGCLPAADIKLVEKLNPNASIMGPNSIDKTIDIVNSALNGHKNIFLNNSNLEKVTFPRVRVNPLISIIEIASGCLSECSFCQTKLAKGDLQSYRIGQIINQIKIDIKTGISEIWLTSTDNGCYGRDIGTNLIELLKRCNEIEGEFKLRVGMMNPMYLRNLVTDLIDTFSYSNKIYKFIHIPVQSGSENILRKMKRGHTATTFEELVKQFRKKIPNITIATDIITGFPGETEDDFELTLKLIQDLEIDIINTSKFSPRPGTKAVEFKRIDQDTILKRSEKLHRIVKQIAKKRNSMWINWEGDILINEIDNHGIKGRNQYYKSILVKEFNEKENSIKNNMIKSSKNISENILSHNSNNNKYKQYLGTTIKVKITGYTNHTLEGIQI